MKNQYQVSFPVELAFSLKMQEQEFAEEVKKLFLVKLYELGKISSGKAGELLGLTRIGFLEMLRLYNISIFNDLTEETLLNDLQNA